MMVLRHRRLRHRRILRLFRARPKHRRVLLHIGAHKTGSTYIQQTLEANRARLPLNFEMVPRRQRNLARLTFLASGATSPLAFKAIEAELTSQARRLADKFKRVENLLVSHEGLPGMMPGREAHPGLYPQAHLILPAIQRGFQQSGAQVHVILYTREFRDWQASLYRYRFRGQPDRQYNPKRFAARTGMPGDWQELIAALNATLPENTLSVVSYEEDRETGLLGRTLYQALGLSEADIAALKRLPPKNVSRPETRHDFEFDE
jgi:hypothetical protein